MNRRDKINLGIEIEQRFKYHPPQSEKRKRQHEIINESSAQFAERVLPMIEDDVARSQIMLLIQQARMLANQEVTMQEVYGSCN